MPSIIVKIKHIKASKKASGFVNYVAKRAGVDKSVNQRVVVRKPTQKQMEYIDEMMRLNPDIKNSFEYEDYMENPTIQNASALIAAAAENSPELFETREMYLNYIATRPNVEKVSEHGLFGSEDSINLNEVKKEIENLNGVIWTPIVSLKREDASRLGYDNADMWRELIRSKQMELAEIFGIPFDEFKWYGAFHNEAGHPHLHMVVYSPTSKKGYITESKIEKVKSILANEIFKNEMYEMYDSKTKTRDRISEETKKRLDELTDRIRNKDYGTSEVCDMLIRLSQKLKSVKGKKTYGYLPKDIKADVDEIVKTLAKDSDIQELYNEWCNIQRKIVNIYRDSQVEFPNLWENKEFKKIRNAVINEAVKLDGDRISFDDANEDYEDEKTDSGRESTEDMFHQKSDVAMHAANLLCRLASIIENDVDKKADGFNKTIVDSKERKKIMQKKQRLGIKMG